MANVAAASVTTETARMDVGMTFFVGRVLSAFAKATADRRSAKARRLVGPGVIYLRFLPEYSSSLTASFHSSMPLYTLN